jgi:hypothetical protein
VPRSQKARLHNWPAVGTCRLIRSIYPELQDHPRTLEYPDVLGMAGNLLLLDHDHPEQGRDEDEGTSRCNRWEASMALGLAKYLMQQGYGPGEGDGIDGLSRISS